MSAKGYNESFDMVTCPHCGYMFKAAMSKDDVKSAIWLECSCNRDGCGKTFWYCYRITYLSTDLKPEKVCKGREDYLKEAESIHQANPEADNYLKKNKLEANPLAKNVLPTFGLSMPMIILLTITYAACVALVVLKKIMEW